MTNEVCFSKKFLISWSLFGFSIGFFLFVSSVFSGEFDFGSLLDYLIVCFFLFPGAGMLAGLMGMICEASISRWKFKEIKHQSLFWHIYPVVVCVTFHLAIAFSVFRGNARN